MIEAMRKMTYKRADGTQVVGMAFTPVFASNFLTLARCLGGDYMTSDKQIVAGEAPMVQLLTTLAELHKAGALPRNWATLNNEEIMTLMQQGRAAMTVHPYARLASYNDPAKGKFAGKLKPVNPPMAAALAGKALCVDGGVLVARDPEELAPQACRLGPAARDEQQGEHDLDGAERQRPDARLELR